MAFGLLWGAGMKTTPLMLMALAMLGTSGLARAEIQADKFTLVSDVAPGTVRAVAPEPSVGARALGIGGGILTSAGGLAIVLPMAEDLGLAAIATLFGGQVPWDLVAVGMVPLAGPLLAYRHNGEPLFLVQAEMQGVGLAAVGAGVAMMVVAGHMHHAPAVTVVPTLAPGGGAGVALAFSAG